MRIEIEYEAPWLVLKVENSQTEEALQPVKKGGIGITNIRKRLDILLEEGYELKQLDTPHSYLVTLKLKPQTKVTLHEQAHRTLEVLSSR